MLNSKLYLFEWELSCLNWKFIILFVYLNLYLHKKQRNSSIEFCVFPLSNK